MEPVGLGTQGNCGQRGGFAPTPLPACTQGSGLAVGVGGTSDVRVLAEPG